MKKKLIISFVIATAAFCLLLYAIMFLSDHHRSKIIIGTLTITVIANAIFIVLLFNRYLRLPLRKPTTKDNTAF